MRQNRSPRSGEKAEYEVLRASLRRSVISITNMMIDTLSSAEWPTARRQKAQIRLLHDRIEQLKLENERLYSIVRPTASISESGVANVMCPCGGTWAQIIRVGQEFTAPCPKCMTRLRVEKLQRVERKERTNGKA